MSEVNHESHQKVRIHIDRKPYELKTPTTGAELYKLGYVAPHRELFKEVAGDHEDVFIPKDHHEIELIQDQHFYSEKEITIVVNARKKETVETRLSFDEVVKLAFETPPTGPNVLFTITYRNGPRENPEGSLLESKSVKIKKGMVFCVAATDRS